MTTKKALLKVKKEIQSFLTKANNRWIEPEDTKYTDILDEYSKLLSNHWQKTRDEYTEKIKTKAFELDDSVEDYDIEPESSNYIDEALALLLLAFGESVLVGYNEIIGRDYNIKLPENTSNFFEEAGEIKKYSHTALTSEQHDMDTAFDKFSGSEDAKSNIKQWFDNNEYRLTDLLLGGLVWYGIQYGFGRAAIESSGTESFLYWITERDKNVCKDCQDLEDNNPYSIGHPLHTVPGGGKTICGSRCRCILEIKER